MEGKIREIFIDEEIEVFFEKKPGLPIGFRWRDKEYKIIKILDFQRRLDFRKPWWGRRHRDFYVVKTNTRQIFEIYFHRSIGKRYWILYKEILEENYIF